MRKLRFRSHPKRIAGYPQAPEYHNFFSTEGKRLLQLHRVSVQTVEEAIAAYRYKHAFGLVGGYRILGASDTGVVVENLTSNGWLIVSWVILYEVLGRLPEGTTVHFFSPEHGDVGHV